MTSYGGLQFLGRFEDVKTGRRVHLVTLGLAADSQVVGYQIQQFYRGEC